MLEIFSVSSAKSLNSFPPFLWNHPWYANKFWILMIRFWPEAKLLSRMQRKMKHKLEHCTSIPSVLLTPVFYTTSLVQKSLHFSTCSNLQCLPSAQGSILLCPCPAARADPCWFTAASGTTWRKQKLLVSPGHAPWLPACLVVCIGDAEGSFVEAPELNHQGVPKGLVPPYLHI